MSTQKAISDLVERFIDDVRALVERARSESRAAALQVVMNKLGEKGARHAAAKGRPAPKAEAPKGRGKPDAAPAVAPAKPRVQARAAKTRTGAGGATAKRSSTARASSAASPRAAHSSTNGVVSSPVAVKAVEAAQPKRRRGRPPMAKGAPRRSPARAHDDALAQGEDAPISTRAASEREAKVLDAVRFLVRATAGEIAQRTGLPNGTVYVVLRSLVTTGQVAKSDTSRGVEYALVSTGGIRPFKRSSIAPGQPDPTPGSSSDQANGASTAPAGAKG
jgi:hypothetical protein